MALKMFIESPGNKANNLEYSPLKQRGNTAWESLSRSGNLESCISVYPWASHLHSLIYVGRMRKSRKSLFDSKV